MQRLTDEQRELAGRPASVRLAERIAAKYIARCPNEADDIRQAAMVGLCDAAQKFRPDLGFTFSTYAVPRITGAVLDHMRLASGLGMGSARGMRRRGDRPVLSHLVALATEACGEHGEHVGQDEFLASRELPVGWELESEDAVRGLLRKVPAKRRAVVSDYYLSAGQTMKAVGAAHGHTESRVSQIVAEATGMLREALTDV